MSLATSTWANVVTGRTAVPAASTARTSRRQPGARSATSSTHSRRSMSTGAPPSIARITSRSRSARPLARVGPASSAAARSARRAGGATSRAGDQFASTRASRQDSNCRAVAHPSDASEAAQNRGVPAAAASSFLCHVAMRTTGGTFGPPRPRRVARMSRRPAGPTTAPSTQPASPPGCSGYARPSAVVAKTRCMRAPLPTGRPRSGHAGRKHGSNAIHG